MPDGTGEVTTGADVSDGLVFVVLVASRELSVLDEPAVTRVGWLSVVRRATDATTQIRTATSPDSCSARRRARSWLPRSYARVRKVSWLSGKAILDRAVVRFLKHLS
jgi:hypothetical protein